MNLEHPASVSPQSAALARAPGHAVVETLDLVDPRIARLIAAERHRQHEKLVFIASESLCPRPVREALARLASDGLVVAEGRSFIVPALAEGDIEDIYALRFLLEPEALRLVAIGLRPLERAAVAALLVHRAVGEQLICVFVDHGLNREGEPEQVEETFGRHFHVPLVHVKAEDRFLARLADVTDPAAVGAMVASGAKEFGRLDMLVNNAALRAETAFADMAFDEWRRVLASILDAAFLCARACLPQLARAGGGQPSPGIGVLARNRLGNEPRQSLQGADVGNEPDVDFLYAEERVLRGVADIAGSDHVERTADAGPLDRSDHRHAQRLEAREGALQLQNLLVQRSSHRGIALGDGLPVLEHGEVHAGAEMLAARGDDEHACRRVALQPTEDFV